MSTNIYHRYEDGFKTIVVTAESEFDLGVQDALNELIKALTNFTQLCDSFSIVAIDSINDEDDDCDEQIDDCVGLTD